MNARPVEKVKLTWCFFGTVVYVTVATFPASQILFWDKRMPGILYTIYVGTWFITLFPWEVMLFIQKKSIMTREMTWRKFHQPGLWVDWETNEGRPTVWCRNCILFHPLFHAVVFFCSNYTMLNSISAGWLPQSMYRAKRWKEVYNPVWSNKNLDLGSSICIVLNLILLSEINGNCAHVCSLQPPWLFLCIECALWQHCDSCI